jgi:hypothetical protein
MRLTVQLVSVKSRHIAAVAKARVSVLTKARPVVKRQSRAVLPVSRLALQN